MKRNECVNEWDRHIQHTFSLPLYSLLESFSTHTCVLTWKDLEGYHGTEAHLFHSVTSIFQPCQDCTCYPFIFWSHTFSALRIMLCMHKWWNGQHTFSLLFETTRVFLVTRNSNLNLTVWDVNQLQSFKNAGWNKRTEMECGNNTYTFCLIWYKWNVETNFKMCNRLQLDVLVTPIFI